MSALFSARKPALTQSPLHGKRRDDSAARVAVSSQSIVSTSRGFSERKTKARP